jgi:hypothetical protein
MAMGTSHLGTFSGALQRIWLKNARLAAIGLSVICATSARSADFGAASPGLRMPDPLWSFRDMYPDLSRPPTAHEYPREFQPRSDIERLPRPDGATAARGADLPLTSAWQRMSEFRSDTGIRLLTLWQATAGTVALHEGRHGGTSLQWTSQALSRGSASRGLLDHLVSTVRDTHAPSRLPAASGLSVHEILAPRAGSP